MTLFDDDPGAAMISPVRLGEITEAYRERLLLNPPTPTFNADTNPKAEAAARYAAKRDVTRFLAVLDTMGLTIAEKGKAE